MTAEGPAGPPDRIGRYVTTALAVSTCTLAGALLVVDFDGDGLLHRPPPPAPARSAWLPGSVSTAIAGSADRWPATEDGVAAALERARPAMAACMDAPATAPHDAIAVARFARDASGEGRVVDVSFEDAQADAPAACIREALAGVVLEDLPDAELIVRFSVRRADP